ncbi:MAG TPA: FAD-dependent oxidoreductase, partial [Candidatus Sulfotelmatobacter sp.]|nr:FAD-dependent oxidoreductase [Candidatus Sulfotelmatobacter sp.]
AGEINELVRSSTRFYRNFRKQDVLVTLVHSQDHILPEVARTLGEFAKKKMEKSGITMRLNTRAVAATHQGIELSNGQMLEGATVVCTIGTTTAPLVQHLDVPKERGRIRTTPDMRIEGQTNAWAIGDCAFIINACDNQPSATTGQFAERQGRQAALNLVRIGKGEATQPFRFKALGQLCSIGGYQAVAEMFGMRVSGFLAWLLWRGVYLVKLPTWSRRIKVGFDWAWDVLFPRDLSFLNTDSGQSLTRAYYRPGDFIQRQGELARVLSVIEEGEVEALQSTEDNPEAKVVAVLAKGDFFGEAVLSAGRHETSTRARTVVRVRQIGSTLFSQVSSAFSPFRDVLSKAIVRRSGDFWSRLPLAKSLLEEESLASILDPLPPGSLGKEATFAEAITALSESATGQLLILDEKQRLWATLDRDDFSHVITRIALTPRDARADLGQRRLDDLLLGNPLYVSLQDSPLVASATMLEHGVSWLPVVQSQEDRRPVGCVRAAKIGNRVMQKIGAMGAGRARAAS